MKIFLTLIAFLNIHSAFAQPEMVCLGEVRQLHSEMLKEDRTLNVYLPDGYSPDSAKTYQVIYLLDGSANEDFIHIVGLVQFLVLSGEMEPSIVVGIANVDRKRDFTFPTTIEKDKQDFPTTGGSANFISFLEKELIPYVNKEYKVDLRRILIGQSLGGLIASEILLNHTDLFSKYVIVSPSLWWDGESLLDKFADTKLVNNVGIYLSVGEKEHPIMVKDGKKLNKILLKQFKNKAYKFEILKNEDHATILHQAALNGLRYNIPKIVEIDKKQD